MTTLTLTLQKDFDDPTEFAEAILAAGDAGFTVVPTNPVKAHPNQIDGQKKTWEEATKYAEKWGCSRKEARSRISALRRENKPIPEKWSE